MKILVLSDSHGNLTNMERAFALEQPDAVFHLGDGAGDFARLCHGSAQFAAACGVAGNCDFGADCPTVRTAEYGGYRFFLTHGHQYQVKYSLMRLYYAAREALADVALFGHTHVPCCQQEGGLWLLNPGTISGRPQATYGLIELQNGTLHCAVRRLED